MLKSFLLCVCLVSVLASFGQRDQGGFITPSDSLSKLSPVERTIYLPADGFTFYEVPNGEFKGKILPGPPLNPPGSSGEVDTVMTSTITGAYIRPQLLNIETYFETSDDRYYLTFSQQRDNHVLVLGDSYRGWISLEEIRRKGFALTSWMEFYGEVKGQMIHPREKIAPILLSPYPDAQVVELADELYSEISSTGKCEGSFCKVQVIQYKNPYDQTKTKEENVLKRYKGWLQIIDDEGRPLVAHNSHGA